MKTTLITFAVGAAVVYVAAQGNTYLSKPGSDGKLLLGATLTPFAAPLVGGLALVLAHKFIGSAA